MTKIVDIDSGILNDAGYAVEIKSAETELDKIARIKLTQWAFVMGHIWTVIILACIGVIMAITFSYVKDVDVSVAQSARTLVMSLVSADIAFVAGRLTR